MGTATKTAQVSAITAALAGGTGHARVTADLDSVPRLLFSICDNIMVFVNRLMSCSEELMYNQFLSQEVGKSDT